MIRNFRLVSVLTGANFYISDSGIRMYMPVLAALLRGSNDPRAFFDDDEDAREKFDSYKARFSAATPYLSAEETRSYDYYPMLLDSGVLVIPVMEGIIQYDVCGIPGTSTIAGWYKRAAGDASVHGILELVNSPGGAVFGTAELGNVKLSVGKPIVSLCEGYCCSAMQWIALASDKILASSENNMFGSIGVMTSFQDLTGYYESLGIAVKDLYSEDSPGKNAAHRAAQKGDYSLYEAGVLKKFDANFIDFLLSRRPEASKHVQEGWEMLTNEAISEGLVERIATFEEAVNEVLKLAFPDGDPAGWPQFQNSMKTEFLSALSVQLGLRKAADASLSDDQVPAAQAALEEKISALITENAQLTASNAQLTASKAQLTKANGDLQARLETIAPPKQTTTQEGNDPDPEDAGDKGLTQAEKDAEAAEAKFRETYSPAAASWDKPRKK